MREFPRENVASAMGLKPSPNTSGFAEPEVEEFVQGIRHKAVPELQVPLLHWEREQILLQERFQDLPGLPVELRRRDGN